MSNHVSSTIDLLSRLSLPDRYERLESALGSQVANLVVPPSDEERNSLDYIAQEISTRDEGILVPLYGPSGAGKTTFASNVNLWKPNYFTNTLDYEGEIESDELTRATKEFVYELPANEDRIVPINIDHRERNPPNDVELSSIKRFLRTKPAGLPTLILWPETSRDVAEEISERYTDIAGPTSIDLPVVIRGPDRDMWSGIAEDTLRLVNNIDSLADLGVNPQDYDVREYDSIGRYMRQISSNFNSRLQELRNSIQKPIRLAIVFVSKSPNPGVLAQLTNSTHYGLLDAQSLCAVTPESEIGEWWQDRRALLTRAIVQLNAHSFSLPPSTAISAIRNCGPIENELLEAQDITRYGPAHGARDFGRSDLGKFLVGETVDRFEARGKPATDAAQAYEALSEKGFTLGKDKNLNRYLAEAGSKLLEKRDIDIERFTAEEKLDFCELIPDNAFYFENNVTCLEYTWRKGEFMVSGNRSKVAQYILSKMRDYVRTLGWTA